MGVGKIEKIGDGLVQDYHESPEAAKRQPAIAMYVQF